MARTTRKSTNLSNKFRAAASNKKSQVIHVVPSKDGWAVKKEGAHRASAIAKSKNEAVSAAKRLKSGSRIVVHGKDGSIQSNSVKK